MSWIVIVWYWWYLRTQNFQGNKPEPLVILIFQFTSSVFLLCFCDFSTSVVSLSLPFFQPLASPIWLWSPGAPHVQLLHLAFHADILNHGAFTALLACHPKSAKLCKTMQSNATQPKFGTTSVVTSVLMSQVRAQCHSLASQFCRPDGYSQKKEKNMWTEQNKRLGCASKDFSATSQSGCAVSWTES